MYEKDSEPPELDDMQTALAFIKENPPGHFWVISMTGPYPDASGAEEMLDWLQGEGTVTKWN